MRNTVIILAGVLLTVGALSCNKLLPQAPEDSAVLDGPLADLTPEQNRRHVLGDEAFSENFTSATGLGSIFVSASCRSCHAGDGKGRPETSLIRFGKWNGSVFDYMLNQGGPQLQNRAIPGFTAEVLPEGAKHATFLPPAVTGLGFLERVSDADILALADENDANGDGISGRPNYIIPYNGFIIQPHHISDGLRFIGRFGRKAGAIDLLQQTFSAYNQDMGITSLYFMNEPMNYMAGQQMGDNVADPEVSGATVDNVVFYLRTLKAPVQRDADNPDVIAGKQVFMKVGCANCHTPTLTTTKSPIAALSEKEFHPYTDLLMHDMGADLDDGYTEGTATSAEWKTQPLWGIGLSRKAQGGKLFLLHDGRATSYEQAIEFHGGESSASRTQFLQLSEVEKQQLTRFLDSL